MTFINFADVLKHAVLCRILRYLCDKPAAFRVIDTHAGSGLYDLAGEKAMRGGEWPDGIGKLMAAKIPDATAALLWPYLDVVRALNDGCVCIQARQHSRGPGCVRRTG